MNAWDITVICAAGIVFAPVAVFLCALLFWAACYVGAMADARLEGKR